MKHRLPAYLLLLVCTFTASGALAADKFGLVFDLEGLVEVTTAAGKTTRLEKGKHLLFPVKEGDRLKTGPGTGKMVVVALKDKTGYELAAGSEAIVEGAGVKAIKGSVRTRKSLSVSTGGAAGPIGAIVLRGTPPASPVAALTPSDTAVLDEAPELRWRATCREPGDVSLQLSEEGKEVFRSKVTGTSYSLPPGVLREGKRYSWSIETPCGKGEADFSVPADRRRLRAELDHRKAAAVSLTDRLSLFFYMVDMEMRGDAQVELEKLQAEFPENRYLREM